MPNIVQKFRQVLCCEPASIDQNEGPPPASSTTAPQVPTITAARDQAQQPAQPTAAAAETNDVFDNNTEEQPEPIEEDWGDEETEPSSYKPEDFVVEPDSYGKYKYDPSSFNGFDEVQKQFEQDAQMYDKNQPAPVDVNSIWGNPKYERSIRNWNADQEFNATPTRAETAAR